MEIHMHVHEKSRQARAVYISALSVRLSVCLFVHLSVYASWSVIQGNQTADPFWMSG